MKKIVYPLIAAGFIFCSCDTCNKKQEEKQDVQKKQEYISQKKMEGPVEAKKPQEKVMNHQKPVKPSANKKMNGSSVKTPSTPKTEKRW